MKKFIKGLFKIFLKLILLIIILLLINGIRNLFIVKDLKTKAINLNNKGTYHIKVVQYMADRVFLCDIYKANNSQAMTFNRIKIDDDVKKIDKMYKFYDSNTNIERTVVELADGYRKYNEIKEINNFQDYMGGMFVYKNFNVDKLWLFPLVVFIPTYSSEGNEAYEFRTVFNIVSLGYQLIDKETGQIIENKIYNIDNNDNISYKIIEKTIKFDDVEKGIAKALDELNKDSGYYNDISENIEINSENTKIDLDNLEDMDILDNIEEQVDVQDEISLDKETWDEEVFGINKKYFNDSETYNLYLGLYKENTMNAWINYLDKNQLDEFDYANKYFSEMGYLGGIGDSTASLDVFGNYDGFSKKVTDDAIVPIDKPIVILANILEECTANEPGYYDEEITDGYTEAGYTYKYWDKAHEEMIKAGAVPAAKDVSYNVNGLAIMNGNNTSKENYYDNARAKKIKVKIGNDFEKTYTLEDKYDIQFIDLNYVQKDFSKPVELEIEVLDYYPGEKSNDVYISDIRMGVTCTGVHGR